MTGPGYFKNRFAKKGFAARARRAGFSASGIWALLGKLKIVNSKAERPKRCWPAGLKKAAFMICLLAAALSCASLAQAAGGCSGLDGLPAEAKVYLAAAGPVQAGRGPTRHFTPPVAQVLIEDPGAQVILMLTAYYRHRWEIATSHNTRIAAVFLTGYEDQELAGRPLGATLIKSSRENEASCQPFFMGRHYPGLILELKKAAGVSRKLFGRDPSGIFYDRNGRIVIRPHQKPEKVFPLDPEEMAAACRAKFNRDQAARLNNSTLAGHIQHLSRAVDLGQLRPASAYDFKNWIASAAQAAHIPAALLSDEYFRASSYEAAAYCYDRSFVIISPYFRFDRRLNGPDGMIFHLEPGLKIPDGFEQLANSLLLMPGGGCRGDCWNITREEKYEARGKVRVKKTYQPPY